MNIQRILQDAKNHGHIDMSIIDNSVVGFYKTHTVKYIDHSGYVQSYLFPITFTLKDNEVNVTALLGFVNRDFQTYGIPRLKSDLGEGAILTVENIENHLYKNLIFNHSMQISNDILSTRIMSLKVLSNTILKLSQIGFPFIKITNYGALG